MDGAIHAAAGPELLAACRPPWRLPNRRRQNHAGFRLPAKFVIHTVGPVWKGGTHGEPELLASAYRRSLEEAVRVGAKTVAFPAISTGVYGYPKELAARVAVDTIRDFLARHDEIREVRLMCYSGATKKALEDALGR